MTTKTKARKVFFYSHGVAKIEQSVRIVFGREFESILFLDGRVKFCRDE